MNVIVCKYVYIIYNIITHNGIYFIYLANLKSGGEKTWVLKVKRPRVKHPGGVKSKHRHVCAEAHTNKLIGK
jgi:hypothetical protein